MLLKDILLSQVKFLANVRPRMHLYIYIYIYTERNSRRRMRKKGNKNRNADNRTPLLCVYVASFKIVIQSCEIGERVVKIQLYFSLYAYCTHVDYPKF